MVVRDHTHVSFFFLSSFHRFKRRPSATSTGNYSLSSSYTLTLLIFFEFPCVPPSFSLLCNFKNQNTNFPRRWWPWWCVITHMIHRFIVSSFQEEGVSDIDREPPIIIITHDELLLSSTRPNQRYDELEHPRH